MYPGPSLFPCQLVCQVIPEGSFPQRRDYSENYQANHAPGTPLSLQLDREMPWLAGKLKVAIPDRYRSLITFSHRKNTQSDYSSSDYMHVMVITVLNPFFKGFFLREDVVVLKRTEICFGRGTVGILRSHLGFVVAVRGTPGVGGTACSG